MGLSEENLDILGKRNGSRTTTPYNLVPIQSCYKLKLLKRGILHTRGTHFRSVLKTTCVLGSSRTNSALIPSTPIQMDCTTQRRNYTLFLYSVVPFGLFDDKKAKVKSRFEALLIVAYVEMFSCLLQKKTYISSKWLTILCFGQLQYTISQYAIFNIIFIDF